LRRQIFTLILWITILVSCNHTEQNSTDSKEDIIASNIRIFIDSCWNNKDISVLKKISTEDLTRNLNGIKVANNQNEMQAHLNLFFRAFPDLSVSLKSAVIKNEQAFTEWTFSGTNTGVFGEVAPTGKKVKVTGFSMIHFDQKGKMMREDIYYNELDLLQQLGYTLKPPIVD